MPVDLLWNSPPDPIATLVLAHGAGAAMDSAWMTGFAELLEERGIRVARFEFDYMAARRTGARKPAPKAERVLDEYRAAVAEAVAVVGGAVYIGGKSYGGRVASMVADELHGAASVEGLVCLGYPFHPPGAPEKLRTSHLLELRTPALICQGTRDPFGTREEVAGYGLPASIRFCWLEDGEHEFKPRKAVSGFTHREHLVTAAEAVREFVTEGEARAPHER